MKGLLSTSGWVASCERRLLENVRKKLMHTSLSTTVMYEYSVKGRCVKIGEEVPGGEQARIRQLIERRIQFSGLGPRFSNKKQKAR